MRPKIVFVVMSALNKPATTEQLARALAPHLCWCITISTRSPHFTLEAPNVRFVPNPKRTGWAVFGFTDGIFYSLRYALENLDFDYLQLLSPTCLPIKPLESVRGACVGAGGRPLRLHRCTAGPRRPDVGRLSGINAGKVVPASSGQEACSNAYFGAEHGRRDEAGIWLRSGAGPGVLPWIALATHQGVVPAVDRPPHLRPIRFARTAARPGSVRAGRSSVAWWRSFHALWCATTSAVCASPMSCWCRRFSCIWGFARAHEPFHPGIQRGPHGGNPRGAYRPIEKVEVPFSRASSRTIRRQPFACGYCVNWPIWTSRRNRSAGHIATALTSPQSARVKAPACPIPCFHVRACHRSRGWLPALRTRRRIPRQVHQAIFRWARTL